MKNVISFRMELFYGKYFVERNRILIKKIILLIKFNIKLKTVRCVFNKYFCANTYYSFKQIFVENLKIKSWQKY